MNDYEEIFHDLAASLSRVTSTAEIVAAARRHCEDFVSLRQRLAQLLCWNIVEAPPVAKGNLLVHVGVMFMRGMSDEDWLRIAHIILSETNDSHQLHDTTVTPETNGEITPDNIVSVVVEFIDQEWAKRMATVTFGGASDGKIGLVGQREYDPSEAAMVSLASHLEDACGPETPFDHESCVYAAAGWRVVAVMLSRYKWEVVADRLLTKFEVMYEPQRWRVNPPKFGDTVD